MGKAITPRDQDARNVPRSQPVSLPLASQEMAAFGAALFMGTFDAFTCIAAGNARRDLSSHWLLGEGQAPH